VQNNNRERSFCEPPGYAANAWIDPSLDPKRGDIVKMAFGIAFGGIVLALALAVGLGSKELVSRSVERQEEKEQQDEKDAARPLSHL
jgi:hypothetical protein